VRSMVTPTWCLCKQVPPPIKCTSQRKGAAAASLSSSSVKMSPYQRPNGSYLIWMYGRRHIGGWLR
jgi:hypothetical protein